MLRRILALSAPLVVLALLGLVACKTNPTAPDAATSTVEAAASTAIPSADASDAAYGLAEQEEEDESVFEGDGGCPLPVHPSYCRRNCRGIGARRRTHHAIRIKAPLAFAFGKCGPYELFAEREASDAGILEYYDDAGELVAAEDQRAKGCSKFGPIPSCKPQLKWVPLATATHGKYTSEGLSDFEVQRALDSGTHRIRDCYEEALLREPTLKGKIIVSLDGVPGERVAKKMPGTDITDPGFLACVTQRLRAVPLMDYDGGMTHITFEVELGPLKP